MAQAQYVIDQNGKKTAVLLSLKEYEKLLADLHDLTTVAQRKEEKPLSFREVKRRLKKDGHI